MRGQKTPALNFYFVEIGFFLNLRSFDVEFEKSIWQGLDGADESAPTCFLL